MPTAPPARPTTRPSPRPHRRLLLRLAAALVALLVLVPTAAAAVEIEEFADYRPQTRCSPSPKPGTVKLLNWLIRKYDGTGSLGISRACGHGGVSEHKEGRALDWAADHSSRRDRRHVENFLDKIFATDRHGNEAALARRMGIMYLIWNDHIYSAYRGFDRRDYLASSCKRKKNRIRNCSVTLRHRNHVHISLSRAGGKGDTSWYHRNDPDWEFPTKPEPLPDTPPTPDDETPWDPETPETDPVLDLERTPYARIVVPADGDSVVTDFALRAGRSYRLTAAGLFGYGSPRQVADATCVWRRGPNEWRNRPGSGVRRDHGALELRVNGKGAFASDCQADHTYTVTFRPERTKPLRLRIANNDGAEGIGGLVVTVARRGTDVRRALPAYPDLTPAPARAETTRRGYGLLGEHLEVPAGQAAGVTTRRELEAGAQYRITVSGRVGLGDGVRSDGHCLRLGDTWWRRASLDRRFPDQDHGDLYLDGAPLGGPKQCAADSYAVDYTAQRDGRAELAVWDPLGHDDNTGSLSVTVQRVSEFATPREAKPRKPARTRPWRRDAETLVVAADDANGVRTRMRLRKGERVQIVVSGRLRSHGVRADATCVRPEDAWRPRDTSLSVDQDPLELWVQGHPRRWRAIGTDGTCSPRHVYTRRITVRSSGPLRLGVLDLDHRDNRGELTVTLLRGKQRWTDAEVMRVVKGA